MIHGFGVDVRSGSVYLTNGSESDPKCLLKITSRGIVPMIDDYETHQMARQLNVQLALASYRQGATLPIRGSWGDRRAYRQAGFKVINANPSARLGRFILGL